MPNPGKIAFVVDGPQGGVFEMNGDGADPALLVTSGTEPAFSHDGTKIAFTGADNGIYVMDADGSGVTKLTNGGSPAWSPDGSQIAFVSGGICIMNADGSNVTRITSDPALGGPLTWSPDGSRIAGVSRHDAPTQPTPPPGQVYPVVQIPNIFIMNRDGTNPTVITNENAGFIYGLSWSPDGTKIAYDWIYPPGDPNSYDSRGITIINTDGSGAQLLPVHGGYPSWSPDGRRIVYCTIHELPIDIFVINADGTGITRLTNNDLVESHTSWAPGTWSTPVVRTDSASAITDSSAMLNGTVVSMGQASSVQVSFKWDTAPGVITRITNETNAVTLTTPGSFSIQLTGLSAGQYYNFAAKSTWNNVVTFGQELGFMASLVTTEPATNIGVTSVTLNGYLSGEGRAFVSATDYFEYGLTTDYGNETPVNSQNGPYAFAATVTNLLPGTVYHFRAVGTIQDVDTNYGTMYGSDLTFTTLPSTPIVSNYYGVTDHGGGQVELHGALESLGTASSVTVSFQWGTTIAYGQTTETKTLTDLGEFSSMVTGLTSGVTYHFRAVAVGNGTAYSDDFAFTPS